MNLKDKVVLVTGGSGGLGEQICYEAAKKGAVVITCARRFHLVDEVKVKCMALSGRPAYAYELDISRPESIEALLEHIESEIGAVDVLVNNAGFGVFENFVEIDTKAIYDMFEVNVLGMMVLTQQIAIKMLENQRGHIMNVASMAGKMATPKTAVYSATKFAVLGFSNALRLELKPFNIHVTTINPGPIRTNFFDLADKSGNYLNALGNWVIDPNQLAKTIVRNMEHPKREINRPRAMEMAARLYTIFPHIGDFLAGNMFNQK